MARKFSLAILGFVLFIAATGCSKQQAITAADKAVLVQVGDLQDYDFTYPEAENYETLSKTRLFDGSYELEYEFETPESEEDNPLYLMVTVSVEKKTSDLILVQNSEKVGVFAGMKLNGMTTKPVPNATKYGDKSTLDMLVYDGDPAGNYFTMRKGKKVYSLMLSGLYFDEADAFDEFIAPHLKAFEDYDPAATS